MAQIIPSSASAVGLISPQCELQLIRTPIKPLGPKDLLVRVEAVSINPVDYKVLQGLNNKNLSEDNPTIAGFDASGVVVKVGSDCQLFKVGDQVFYAGSYIRNGSFQNYQIVDERIVGIKPKKLSHSEAAAIPLVALTAYEGLVEEMRIPYTGKQQKLNKTILIVGGAGGVGSMTIQIAKNVLGLTVIATASREQSKQFCIKMGADYVINHNQPLAEQLKNINVDGLDYVYNCVEMGKSYFDQFASLIKPFGHILGIVGFDEPLDLKPLFYMRAKITAELMFTRSMFNQEPEKQNQILNHISELYDKQILISTIQITKKFSIENLKQMLELSESGKTIGKIVLSDVQGFFDAKK
ncbi:zinc-binding alcohol dehydrogenase family protein (macronuclear) [Tetrahymena thermophila SB210]|uniref:Zinc-binding alcohol dehydrogenase family protein n=1 Tax=Tetrahymena thermophila (strain SB210) TaxID=312017 RepID=I7MEH8_TETTS|nr:zinc-binding alcohol dehydrogenase family protein [Tetrahymena thermophila SB210]EAR96383.1 zinc-binding alcohol dehydrogenase family protein [Tetrahymena thermophila SB210]|eukprot:XP_001016628.1 zinc-binding alcohol dehydrogenase family protein [Tetrahymena thermophila SB210]